MSSTTEHNLCGTSDDVINKALVSIPPQRDCCEGGQRLNDLDCKESSYNFADTSRLKKPQSLHDVYAKKHEIARGNRTMLDGAHVSYTQCSAIKEEESLTTTSSCNKVDDGRLDTDSKSPGEETASPNAVYSMCVKCGKFFLPCDLVESDASTLCKRCSFLEPDTSDGIYLDSRRASSSNERLSNDVENNLNVQSGNPEDTDDGSKEHSCDICGIRFIRSGVLMPINVSIRRKSLINAHNVTIDSVRPVHELDILGFTQEKSRSVVNFAIKLFIVQQTMRNTGAHIRA
eukprot:gene1550-15999_t